MTIGAPPIPRSETYKKRRVFLYSDENRGIFTSIFVACTELRSQPHINGFKESLLLHELVKSVHLILLLSIFHNIYGIVVVFFIILTTSDRQSRVILNVFLLLLFFLSGVLQKFVNVILFYVKRCVYFGSLFVLFL